jgi:hypothetical protein
MLYDEFKADVMEKMANRPSWSRKGQFVFNYIEEKYGDTARYVQFIDNVDCFYNDDEIERFLIKCYCHLKDLKTI